VSANLVNKTLVDLLVTAAVKSGEPENPWFYYSLRDGTVRVTTANADQLGQMLWLKNWQHVEGWADPVDRQMRDEPSYRYEPVGGVPDPLLVLKQIQYYEYQTAGDDARAWLVSEQATFLRWLQTTAIGKLPRYIEAPWGIGDDKASLVTLEAWCSPDLNEAAHPDDRDDPQWAVLDEQLRATSLPFTYVGEHRLYRFVEGLNRADERGLWVARGPHQMWGASATLFATEAAAQTYYAYLIDQLRHGIGGTRGQLAVLRHARVVIQAHKSFNPEVAHWRPDDLLAAFADADERWTAESSVEVLAPPEVVAERVALTPAGEIADNLVGGAAIVARTPKSVDKLLTLVADPDLRARIAEINIRDRSIILLTAVGAVDLIGTTDVIDLGHLASERRPFTQVELEPASLSRKTGAVLTVPALRIKPERVFLKGQVMLPVVEPR
jgi:hypothetical protein